MARTAPAVVLSAEEEAELRRLARAPSTPQKTVQRARIALRAAGGATNTQIASELGLSLPTVGLWRARIAREGPGLDDAPRPGRPRTIDEATRQEIIARALEPPPDGTSHWSTRRLAAELGISPSSVQRVWAEHRLEPHRTRTFKHSRGPELVPKVVDICGLCLNPPEGALVLCVDGKTQVRALDRTQPIPPVRPGLPEGRTDDYTRHGTTSLYAALVVASGQVVAECHPRHRATEFLCFLRRIDREFPEGALHLVVDSSSTHSTPEVRRWLERHPRVVLHLTPKGAGWMNLVESWFSILTRQHIRRGTHRSVRELVEAIERFVAGWNQRARPFTWTKRADEVLAKAVKGQDTSGAEH